MITVKGREKHLFEGKNGGNFYLKGNNKVYVNLSKKSKKSKKSPKKSLKKSKK